MAKMTEEDKKYWNKILEFVEKEILNYDDNQHIQKMAVLKLKGLLNGKEVANNKTKNNGEYSYKVIYATFLMCRKKIQKAMASKSFENEANAVGYICAIIRNNINTAYELLKKKEQAEKKTEEIDTGEIGHTGVEYVGIIEETRANKYEGLW